MTMERIADRLKEMIDREGPEVLTGDPYKLFTELTESGASDRKTAGALMYTFLMGTPELFADGRECSPEEISGFIQKECGFRKKISDRLTEVYISLYSRENKGQWNSMRLAGLKSFMGQKWEIEWDGKGEWDGGQVYVDCSCKAAIVISPLEGRINDPELDQMLAKNPFLKSEEIFGYFRDSLLDCLDREFDYYCTCDDYYPPVAEDFEAEYYAENWCKEHGFELVSFDGEGFTGDYEPKSTGRWY